MIQEFTRDGIGEERWIPKRRLRRSDDDSKFCCNSVKVGFPAHSMSVSDSAEGQHQFQDVEHQGLYSRTTGLGKVARYVGKEDGR